MRIKHLEGRLVGWKRYSAGNNREEVKEWLNKIYNTKGEIEARKIIGKWAGGWEGEYSSSLECLKKVDIALHFINLALKIFL